MRNPSMLPVLPLASALVPTLAGLLLAAPLAQAGEPSPAGRWLTASGNLEVQVEPCGDKFCGRVVKVLANRSMSHPGQEMQGPMAGSAEAALGLAILRDFSPVPSAWPDDPTLGAPFPPQEPQWVGTIHNRENGQDYRCLMTLGSTGELVLRPYIGLPLIGKTQVWHAVAEPDAAAPKLAAHGTQGGADEPR